MVLNLNKQKIFLLMLVTIIFFTCRYFFKQNPTHDLGGAPTVSVASVASHEVLPWKAFSGRLMAIEQVEIRSRVSGMIEQIHFKNGAIIKKGDLLFTIDPRPYEAEVARAQGTLASIEAQAILAKAELLRAEQLIKEKVISQSEFDKRFNAFNVIQAKIRSARASKEAAKLNLEFTKVRSPITGKISRAEITVGNLVEAGPHAFILATVVSNTPIYADFDVDEETYLQYVHTTEPKNVKEIPVKMGLATEKEFSRLGHIESFDNHLNPTSGTIRVRALFDNTDGSLVPGLFARIKLGEAQKKRVLLITERAIGTDQNKKFVWVIDKNNIATYREVKLGEMIDGMRIVYEGLNVGDKIVVNGLQRIRPGQAVGVQEVSMDSSTQV